MKANNIDVGEIYAIRVRGRRDTLRHVTRSIVVGKNPGEKPKIWYVVLRANETEAPEGAARQWVRGKAVVALWPTVAPEIVEQWQGFVGLDRRAQDDAERRAEGAAIETRKELLKRIGALSNAELLRVLEAR